MSAREQALWQEVQTLRSKLDAKNKQISNLRVDVHEMREAVKDAQKQIVSNVRIEMIPKWKEGHPDHQQEVLVKTDLGARFMAWYNPIKQRWASQGMTVMLPITHWMEIPE